MKELVGVKIVKAYLRCIVSDENESEWDSHLVIVRRLAKARRAPL